MDYPLLEMAAEANKHVQAGARVWQKWTCGHCGSRQTMDKENTFYKSGKCEECGQVTTIENCGYMLLMGKQPGES